MTRSYSITLTTLTPSNNQLLKMHWAVKKRLRGNFVKELYFLLRKAGWKQPVNVEDIGRMRLTVQIYRAPRRFDHDNSVGGMKPLIDALRDIKAIRNDSPVWLELVVPEEMLATGLPRVEITLEEA